MEEVAAGTMAEVINQTVHKDHRGSYRVPRRSVAVHCWGYCNGSPGRATIFTKISAAYSTWKSRIPAAKVCLFAPTIFKAMLTLHHQSLVS